MSQHRMNGRPRQIEVLLDEQKRRHTDYAGVLALRRSWGRLGVDACLQEAEIGYGRSQDKAAAMSFALMAGPLVEASSLRRIAQRFGSEPSKNGVEADVLLRQLVGQHFDQRTLDRFANTERYQWRRFQQARVRQLQQMQETAAATGGVVVVDDFPIPKPYAEEMAYLSPIWDSNQERVVPGYLVVHLYYYHPRRPAYSLYAEPWRNTSATGETKAKPRSARRPARADEQRSKLDIAHQALGQFLPLLPDYEAVIFDSWYTARWFAHALTEMEASWIGVCESRQKFEVHGDYLLVPEIIERYHAQQTPLSQLEGVKAMGLPAVLRPDKYTKVAQAVQLVLVTGLHEEEDETRLLICNRRDWRAHKIVKLFSYRPTIEQGHRQGKQAEGWADFQTRSWPCLQAHFAFALLRSTLLTLLTLWCAPLQGYSLREIIVHGIRGVAHLSQRATDHLLLYLPRGQPLLWAMLKPP